MFVSDCEVVGCLVEPADVRSTALQRLLTPISCRGIEPRVGERFAASGVRWLWRMAWSPVFTSGNYERSGGCGIIRPVDRSDGADRRCVKGGRCAGGEEPWTYNQPTRPKFASANLSEKPMIENQWDEKSQITSTILMRYSYLLFAKCKRKARVQSQNKNSATAVAKLLRRRRENDSADVELRNGDLENKRFPLNSSIYSRYPASHKLS